MVSSSYSSNQLGCGHHNGHTFAGNKSLKTTQVHLLQEF
jgi:hypothetical protein